MEFPGILSQPKKVSSDNSSARIDLTLRLGLPHNDKQNQGNQLVTENMAVQTGEMSKAGTNFTDFSSQQRIGSQEKIENNASVLKRSCKRCGVVNTPIWRKGPDGSQTLCNACGLRCSRALKKAATVLGPDLNWNHQQSVNRTG